MKTILSLTVAAGLLVGPTATPVFAADTHNGWRCNAYGYGGPREAWQTVTGERNGSERAAREAATDYCSHERHLNGCRGSGCWPE